MKGKPPRYIVFHERIVTRFPWIVVDSTDGKPALWHHHPHVGKVPRRFRTQGLAQAAADKLNAEAKPKTIEACRPRTDNAGGEP